MNEVKISHNHAESQTIIEIPANLNVEKSELAIFDILGHEVFTVTLGQDNKAIVGNDKMSQGTYYYRIFQNGKLLACGKLAVE